MSVTYRTAVGDALSNLEQIPIMPEHIWAKDAVGKGKALDQPSGAPTAGHPVVGAGPFLFVKYVPNQVLLLVRNPRFWGPKPKIKGFGVELFANDDALVAAMTAHDVDAATGDPNLPPTDIRPLARSHIRIEKHPSVALNDLIINTNPAKSRASGVAEPGGDARRSNMRLTGRRSIGVSRLRPGGQLARPACHRQVVRPGGQAPAVQPVEGERTAQPGRIQDGANTAPDPRWADGHPMSYTVLLSPDNGPEGVRTGQIMTTDFAKIGVRLNFQPIGDNALNSAIYANHYRNFDMAMWGWDAQVDPNYILDVVTCSQWYNKQRLRLLQQTLRRAVP